MRVCVLTSSLSWIPTKNFIDFVDYQHNRPVKLMPDSENDFCKSFIVMLEHKSSWKAHNSLECHSLYSVTVSFICTEIVKPIHKAVSRHFWPYSVAYLCTVVQYVDVSFQLFAACVRVSSSTRQHVLFIHAEASDQWALIDFNELIKDRKAGGHIVEGYMSMCACVLCVWCLAGV